MQYYTLFQLAKDMDSNLHGGGVSQLQDFFATVDKGRRAMIGKIRPPELVRKNYLEEATFPSVDRYAVPDDLKYRDVLELGLLSGYRNVDTMNNPLTMVWRRRFDQKRNGAVNVMNIGYENGVKFARVFHTTGLDSPPWVTGDTGNSGSVSVINGNQYVLIHDCDTLSDNGTWNIGGNVVNLRLDELYHVVGRASLKFDINDSSTAGYIENFTLDAFDLDDFLQRGAAFAWLNIPLPQNLLSVKLTMGSDTGNLLNDLYYSTVDQPHDNNEFMTGWNLLKYMLNNLSTVGTPNPKALVYIRFDFTTNGDPIPNCNLDNIVARKGRVYEAVYNTSWCLMSANHKTWKKIGTAYDDIIVAEEDTYNCFLWECTLAAQKEIYGSTQAAKGDVSGIQEEMDKAYARYLMEHPSEALLDQDSTHIFGNQYDGLTDDPLPGYGGGLYGQG